MRAALMREGSYTDRKRVGVMEYWNMWSKRVIVSVTAAGKFTFSACSITGRNDPFTSTLSL